METPHSLIPIGDGCKIVKVKNTGENLEIAFSTTFPTVDENGAALIKKDEVQTVSKFPHKPHQLLEKAFDSMKPHVAFLFGFLNPDFFDEDLFKEFEEGVLEQTAPKEFEIIDRLYLRGYSTSGSNSDIGIILSGGALTHMGLNVTVNTPFIRLNESRDDIKYAFQDRLNKDFNILESRIWEYMHGKRWTDGQLDLFE